LPHLQTSPEAVEMFLEEARLGAALTSPNVIQVYELGRDGTNYSIIMEHISGHDLGKLIYASHTTGRRIPIAIACRIAHDICSGLHAAHTFRDEKGRLRPIIHRDISPENVLISVSGNVKILDFGIARQTTSEHHQSNIYRGKIIYSPPEQILRKVVDTRADIYAAGLVLYVMIAGVHPFHRPTPALSVEAVLNAEAPPLRSLRQDVPADVAALVEQALARDPDRRVLTAEAMTRGLDACMAKRGLVATETHVEAWLRDLVREAPEGTFAPRERAPPASANTSQATVALVPDHATTPHGVVEEVQQTLWALPRISRHDDVPLSATPRQDDGDER
jgi:serine/threonine protein kinase